MNHRAPFPCRIVVAAALGLALCPGPARAGEITFTRITDTAAPAPGQKLGIVNFGAPAISGGNVVFFGSTTAGAGIYTVTLNTTAVAPLTDFTMTRPGFLEPATSFGASAVSGGSVVLYRSTSEEKGIYLGAVGQTGVRRLVDASTAAPGQSSNFDEFSGPAISGKTFVFTGYSGHGSAKGIYTGTLGEPGSERIVDTSMVAPGQAWKFTNFSADVAIAGGRVAFSATYGEASDPAASEGWGIYIGKVGVAGAVRVADLTTMPPGKDTPFTVFPGPPGLSGSNLAFVGWCREECGIYLGAADASGGLTRVVDQSSAVPGHEPLTFTNFAAAPALSGNHVAFAGGYDGGSGVFLAAGGKLAKVVGTGDALFGSTVTGVELGPACYDGNTVVFHYYLADGTQGEAAATVEP